MSNERGGNQRTSEADVDAAWRAASADEPSPQTDAAILAAARAETRSVASVSPARTGAPWWTRWRPLAAAAGVAGLAFVLVQRLPTEPGSVESLQAPAPTAQSVTASPEAVAVEDAPVSEEAPAQPHAGKRLRAEGTADRPPTQSSAIDAAALPAVPALTGPVEPPMASQGLLREAARPFPAELADRAEDVDPNGTPQTSAPLARKQGAGIAVAKSEADVPALEDWVQRIVDLHDAGDLPAAAQELQALRRAYPDADARLPTGLRAWATTVGPDGEP